MGFWSSSDDDELSAGEGSLDISIAWRSLPLQMLQTMVVREDHPLFRETS